jgi:hypothetical protein
MRLRHLGGTLSSVKDISTPFVRSSAAPSFHSYANRTFGRYGAMFEVAAGSNAVGPTDFGDSKMNSWIRSRKAPDVDTCNEESTLDKLLAANRSQEEFVLLYCRLIQDRLPDRQLTLEEPTVVLVEAGKSARFRIYLGNLWLQLQGTPDGRRELVERHLRVTASMAQPRSAIERRQIVPIIKDATYMKMGGSTVLAEHLAADLWVVFAVDREDWTENLNSEQIEPLGLEKASLHDIAVENLKMILPEIECHGEGPWFLVTAGGDYVASILLLDRVWEQLADRVDGDIVAAVPSRDVLLFTGARSTDGLVALREKAMEVSKGGDHTITDTLLRRCEGKWIAFS